MADSSDSSPMGFLWRHYEEVKEHWRSNFSFLDYYKKTLGRKEPLPKWTDADVEEFIASDPVYGPQLKVLRESRKYAIGGALVGAAHLGGVSLGYSKSPHGFVLATAFGALCGGVFGLEVAEHWGQLYKIDKQAANLRFLYWWEDKISGKHVFRCLIVTLGAVLVVMVLFETPTEEDETTERNTSWFGSRLLQRGR